MKNTLLLFLLFSGFNTQAQITDIDGNSYDTVRIGDQTWMAENLNVSRFRNGDTIFEAKTTEEFIKAGENQQPAWCYYDFNPNNGDMYGKLYNWHAVNDSRGIAKEGWHVPSDDEWNDLVAYLGGENIAGKKIKSSVGWENNGNGSNSCNFNAVPAGLRVSLSTGGYFNRLFEQAFFWSSTEYNIKETGLALYRHLDCKDDVIFGSTNFKSYGFSIRCIKN